MWQRGDRRFSGARGDCREVTMVRFGRPVRAGAVLACFVLLATGACADDDPEEATTTSTTVGSATTTTTTTASTTTATSEPDEAGVVVFSGAGNNLDAYEGEPPFRHQRVNSAFTPEPPQEPNPRCTNINAQIAASPTVQAG